MFTRELRSGLEKENETGRNKMKKIEAIKHILAYTNKDFMEHTVETVRVMEEQGLEVEIQYSNLHEALSALIIGRRVEVAPKATPNRSAPKK